MITDACRTALDAHIADGITQHPDVKPLDSYPVLIREWATKLEYGLRNENSVIRYKHAAKLMLQLAGLCIRGIEDHKLPLSPPGTVT